MKRILGVLLYVSAAIVGLFVTLVLFLQAITTMGLISRSGKEPGLFLAISYFLIGAMLTLFLVRLGHHILQNKNELSVAAKTYLLIIALSLDVAIFLKSAVSFLTQGHGTWSGSVALLSVITFAFLCWMFTKM